MADARDAIAEALTGVPDRHALAQQVVDALHDAGYEVVDDGWYEDACVLIEALRELPERRRAIE